MYDDRIRQWSVSTGHLGHRYKGKHRESDSDVHEYWAASAERSAHQDRQEDRRHQDEGNCGTFRLRGHSAPFDLTNGDVHEHQDQDQKRQGRRDLLDGLEFRVVPDAGSMIVQFVHSSEWGSDW